MAATTDRHKHVICLTLGLLVIVSVLSGCFGGRPEPECEFLTWDGYDITVELVGGAEEIRRVYPSDAGLDADGDQVDDCVEFLNKTDPNDADTSSNGLLDGRNVTLDANDPKAKNWIDRGIVFVDHGDLLEFQGARAWRLEPTKQDHGGDGILDGDEVRGFSVWILGLERVVATDPRRADTSGDGLVDAVKRDMGLDPTTRDTMGDGIDDIHDVNPWIDFQVEFRVESLTVKKDPFGRSELPLWLEFDLPGVHHHGHGDSGDKVRVDQQVHGASFSSSDPLGPSNDVGDLWTGQHNVTFSAHAFTQRGDELHLVDLFSHTTGDEEMYGAIHALTGELYWSSDGQSQPVEPWPSTFSFEGEHGNITFQVLPVWPEAWQECIDNGCRHGSGEFPYR